MGKLEAITFISITAMFCGTTLVVFFTALCTGVL